LQEEIFAGEQVESRYLPAAMFTGMVLAASLLFLGVLVFTYLVKG
jgi:hypothetical protein